MVHQKVGGGYRAVHLEVEGELAEPVGRLKQVGDLLYTAAGGFLTIDVSDPERPRVAGRGALASLPRFANDFVVAGDRAYVAAAADGLAIVDISAAKRPRQVGSFKVPGYPGAYAVAVSGGYVFLGEPEYLGVSAGGLRVINVSNAAAPTEEYFLDTPGGIHGIARHGDVLYARDYGSPAGGGWIHQILVVDVSTPTQPRTVGSIRVRHPGITDGHMVVSDGVLFVDGRQFDLANPLPPAEIGSYSDQESGLDRAESLAVSADWIAVTTGISVLLFDRVDPHTAIAGIGLPYPNDFTYHVYLDGDRLIVVTGEDFPPRLFTLSIKRAYAAFVPAAHR